MKDILLVFFGCLLISSSCRKQQEDKLPPATQTGANTFGCLVNGNAWVPTGRGVGSGIYPTAGGFYANVDNSLNIFIKAYSENEIFQVFLKHAIAIGDYPLNKNTAIMPGAIFPESYGSYSINGQEDFITDSLHTGIVQITYADTVKGIVSGTFEMQLYQKNTGKVINITKGRFDYKNH